jgi:hypothetical protein
VRQRKDLPRDDRGAAVIEMAFALPVLIIFLWMMVQLALVFRASAGIQHALGEGARLATIWPQPTTQDIVDEVNEAVYGIGPGRFDPPLVEDGTDCDDRCIDVTLTYRQPLDLLVLPGPTVEITRTKRVWVAVDDEE